MNSRILWHFSWYSSMPRYSRSIIDDTLPKIAALISADRTTQHCIHIQTYASTCKHTSHKFVQKSQSVCHNFIKFDRFIFKILPLAHAAENFEEVIIEALRSHHTANTSSHWLLLNVSIQKYSVAKRLRCGGIFKRIFTAECASEIIKKAINIWWLHKVMKFG